MKSPLTGKEMKLIIEPRVEEFRKESFTISHHSFLCEDTKEQFTTTELDEINTNQIYNQYRYKHNLPFPDEIIAIRENYGLPATKMSEILGFGVNVYRNYENGEVPNESNARLIQMAKSPTQFIHLIELNTNLTPDTKSKYIAKIEPLTQGPRLNRTKMVEAVLLDASAPNEYTGYKKPCLAKFTEMVKFFTKEMKPYKTKLNKLLFYADFLNFKSTGYSISGMTYYAIDLGPVPQNFNGIFEHIAQVDEVDVMTTQFGINAIGEQFLPNEKNPFSAALFTSNELETMEKVAKKFRSTSTNDIIEISHTEAAWKNNKTIKGKISYQDYGFEIAAI